MQSQTIKTAIRGDQSRACVRKGSSERPSSGASRTSAPRRPLDGVWFELATLEINAGGVLVPVAPRQGSSLVGIHWQAP